MNKLISLLILLTLSLASVKAQNVERYKAYHDKGRMFILEGKYEEAITQLDTAIQIMPYYARIFQDRGYAYMQLKNYKLAIRDFNHVLKKQPYLNEVKLQRGMALYHLNYLDEAERELIAIKKARPDKNIEATYYLESINKEKELMHYKEQEEINLLRYQTEFRRLKRARHREDIIWNTVVPLAFWTSVFLAW